MRILCPLALLALIAGCNTVEGVGRDIQSGGRAVEKAAEEVKQALP